VSDPRNVPAEDGPGTPRRRWLEAAFVAALALTLNLVGNGRISLWDRDEPRYAGCTREMRARGDWVYPTFNAEPRFHKPILIYWLMRGGLALGGDNPFGARLPSALAGAGTSLAVLALGRRMFGPRAGLFAALMLTTAPIMVAESKLATTDATLALWLVLAQLCLWELSRRPSGWLAASFWVLMGLATLTKGPVGLGLIAASGGASWWFGGPRTAWGRLRWRWGVWLSLLVAAPWFVAVGVISRGEFFRFALGSQVAARMVREVEQHHGFPGYYVVTSLALFHPWSALLPPALYAAWARRRSASEFGFLLGWVVGPLVLLECVQTKLIHYYLPAYPACALLTGWVADRAVRDGVSLDRWRFGRLGLRVMRVVGFCVSAGAVAGSLALPAPLRWPFLTVSLVAAPATVWAVARLRRGETSRAVLGLAASSAVAAVVFAGWLLPAAEPYRMPRVVAERLARMAGQFNASPVLLSFQEPSIIYTMRRPAVTIRTWDRFHQELDRHGALVTAIIPLEYPEFLRRRNYLDVDVRETVRGFNLTKGETQTIRLAVIRRRETPLLVDRAPTESLLVK
jgi:4-amino-4-deoxy-L-arabinose transferase-like glycosyltransferase